MDDADRLQARLCAALLEAGRVASPMAGVLALLGGAGLLLAALKANVLAAGLFGLALALLPAIIWYALRVRFDVAAFREIGALEKPDALQQFDAALLQLGLRTQPDGRPLALRAAGARRLLTRLLGLIAAQLALFMAGSAIMLVTQMR